jgi:hypothetical protein
MIGQPAAEPERKIATQLLSFKVATEEKTNL